MDDPSLSRAIVFQDSFGEALRPFLSERFQRVVYSWQVVFDPGMIERERPAVVIHEMVERTLMVNLPPRSRRGHAVAARDACGRSMRSPVAR